jgi:hypothetical protein
VTISSENREILVSDISQHFSIDDPEFARHIVSSVDHDPLIFDGAESLLGIREYLMKISVMDVEKGPHGDGQTFRDRHTDYSVGKNSFGYRSPEFVDSPEILFAGCSVTYGVGVPVETIWTSRVAELLNVTSYVSLGWHGASAQSIVANIYKYIQKYGKPAKILALFPDPYRLPIVADSRNLTFSGSKTTTSHPVDAHLNLRRDDVVKYSKAPHAVEEILVPEVGFRSAIDAIHSLEVFCKASGIDLIWSSWSVTTNLMYMCLSASGDFDSYPLFPSYSIEPSREYYKATKLSNAGLATCHSELIDKYPNQYHFGTDSGGTPHPGVHSQFHIALGFIEALKKKSENNSK